MWHVVINMFQLILMLNPMRNKVTLIDFRVSLTAHIIYTEEVVTYLV